MLSYECVNVITTRFGGGIMDVKKIFQELSEKMLSDFRLSAHMKHSGNKGGYREDTLKTFLKEGKLPEKFGIGAGEIIGPSSEVSRQSDLIIYDRYNCPVLVFGESIQVIPSEAVYGIIEVKSKLSKQKLYEGLENIASFKKIVPQGMTKKQHSIMVMNYVRPRPFGMIFAYSLEKNSLESLVRNLREYEGNLDPDLWPNLIVVLNEGIIYHSNEKLKVLLRTEDFNNEIFHLPLAHKKDTLFEFYINLFDMLSKMELGDFDLRKYKELPKKVGQYYVTAHDRFVNYKTETVSALNEIFINEVVNYCKIVGKKTRKEILMLEFGEIPSGLDENELNGELYYYDPENLPGFHEVDIPILKGDNGNYISSRKMRMPNFIIIIDGECYEFPQAYIKPEHLTVIDGVKPSDL